MAFEISSDAGVNVDLGEEGERGERGFILLFVITELAVAEYFLSRTFDLYFIGVICDVEDEIGRISFIFEQALGLCQILFFENIELFSQYS